MNMERELGEAFGVGARDQARTLLGQGAHTVAAMCWWSLDGVRVRRADLRAELTALGLGKAVQRDPAPHATLARAVRAADARCEGVVADRVGGRRWALLASRTETAADGETLVLHDHVITLGTQDGELVAAAVPGVAVTPAVGAAAAIIAEEYRERREWMHGSELGATLVRALRGNGRRSLLGALSLRGRTGGVYLVPAGSLPALRALREVVQRAGKGSDLEIWPIAGDAATLEAASRAVRADVTSQLRELREELQGAATEITAVAEGESDGMAARSCDVRLARVGVLTERVEMWADALGSSRAELLAQLDAAKAAVREAYGL